MTNLEILFTMWTIAYLTSIPGMWVLFKKLGINPRHSLLPLVNFVVLMRFYQQSLWLLILFITPIGLIYIAILNYKIAKSFGLNIGFAIGLSLWFTKPIFINLLGFGNHEFIGNDGMV